MWIEKMLLPIVSNCKRIESGAGGMCIHFSIASECSSLSGNPTGGRANAGRQSIKFSGDCVYSTLRYGTERHARHARQEAPLGVGEAAGARRHGDGDGGEHDGRQPARPAAAHERHEAEHCAHTGITQAYNTPQTIGITAQYSTAQYRCTRGACGRAGRDGTGAGAHTEATPGVGLHVRVRHVAREVHHCRPAVQRHRRVRVLRRLRRVVRHLPREML